MYGHLIRFYADRFFRLGPALLVMVSITYYYHSQKGSNSAYMAWVRSSALYAIFYLTNWRSLYAPWVWTAWDHTWSLACEEQFYILWSLILPMVIARGALGRRIFIACSLIVLIYVRVWMSIYPGGILGPEWHYGLWANMWKMMLGASVRLIAVPDWLLQKRFAYVGLLGLSTVLAYMLCFQESSPSSFESNWRQDHIGTMTWTDFCSGIFTIILLCGLHGPGQGIKILESQTLRFLGRVSYSWYLWQFPILLLRQNKGGYDNWSNTAVALVVASCSTFWIEEPLLRLYKSWRDDKRHRGLPLSFFRSYAHVNQV
jgi:peptidoglycan/LPS O-acetylase OafA/YrhL